MKTNKVEINKWFAILNEQYKEFTGGEQKYCTLGFLQQIFKKIIQ